MMHCWVVDVIVHTENNRKIFVLGRSRDNDLLDGITAMRNSLGRIGEETCGFDNDIDILRSPRNRSWILLSKDTNLLAIDNEVVAISFDSAIEWTVV